MPADLKKLIQEKDIILSTIRNRGPCLPVHIARAANLSLLFASAYLSELFGENRIKMSNMRVGSSPLYFLEGQEAHLENFIQHLAPKEKEAVLLLKQEKLLEDQKLQPAIRVALRELKDFAVPLKVKTENEARLFWKHAFTPDEEAKALLNQLIPPSKKKKEKSERRKKEEKIQPPTAPALLPEKEEKHEKTAQKIIKKPKEDSLFIDKIKEYLKSKDMELLDISNVKKKECLGKIRIDTLLGKQDLLLIVKDKKRVTEDDITIAVHKAQIEKMPILMLSSGNLDKDAQNFFQLWQNLIKFEKIKL